MSKTPATSKTTATATSDPFDPFAFVQPIGQRGGPPTPTTNARPKPLQLPRSETWRRLRRNKSNQTGLRSSTATVKQPGSHPGSRARVRLLTNQRALEIISHLSEQFYTNACDVDRRDGDRKQATAALGISLDKFVILSSRAGSDASKVRDADQARSGVLELAQRLAAAIAERSA